MFDWPSSLQDLVDRNRYSRGYDPIGLVWEQKAVAVVNCINTDLYQVKAAMLLAKYCQVPWSECIEQTVERMSYYTCDGSVHFICQSVSHSSITSNHLPGYALLSLPGRS